MLSSPERLQDPANHCTPILDSFEDQEDSNAAYIVMPLYRKFDDPPFYYVEEVVDFIRQTLEVRKSKSLRVSYANLGPGVGISSQSASCS